MLAYPHFAVQGLLLLNGYEEHKTAYGVQRSYSFEDRLELCVQRILLRKPERLRGWDLRFLRRGLSLSQAQFGKLIDRDAQTVARWEKSKRRVPQFADLAIRCRFAERFEVGMRIKELLKYVDGNAPKLPKTILLRLEGDKWTFSFYPRFSIANTDASARASIVIPARPRPTQIVYAAENKIVKVREKIAEITHQRREGMSRWRIYGGTAMFSIDLNPRPSTMRLIEYTATHSQDINYTRH